MPTRYHSRTTFAALLALAIAPLAVRADDCEQWDQLTTGGPSARAGHAMAYDAARQRVVMFGGYANANANQEPQSDTWLWNGTAWNPANASGPSPRFYHAMVYDSFRQRVVLFGGQRSSSTGVTYLGDTWEWDGRVWTQAATSGPPARSLHALAYDSSRRRVVLFGGLTVNGPRDQDTWEWNGTSWTRVSQVGPAFRYAHAMTFDQTRGRTLLFGGYGTPERNKDYLADTWEWNGQTWIRVATTGPAGRFHHSLTYNTKRHRVLLVGGKNATGAFPDSWEWTGTQWQRVAGLGALARDAARIAFDSLRGRVVMFGGFVPGFGRQQDTWEQTLTFTPTIQAQSVDITNPIPGLTVTLVVNAQGARPLQYQWFRNSVPIPADAPRMFGVTTDTLTIAPYETSDAGLYSALVLNACGQVMSRMTAVGHAGCPADVDDGSGQGNRDGGVTIDDLIYYLPEFQSGSTHADIDDGSGTGTPDGGVTIDDLLFFLFHFDVGC